MSWYRTGTVAVTNGSKTVTGVGTLFTTAVNVGDAFALVDANLNPTGAWYEVDVVVSNTEITLKQSYAGTTGSNKQYCVFNMVGNMTTPSFAQRLATFFANFQTLLDKPTSTPTALGIPVADENGNIADGWISTALLESNDAMVFKGTLGTGGTVTALPTADYVRGWTYKIITAGTYAGVDYALGDLIIALTSFNTEFKNSDWIPAHIADEMNLKADVTYVDAGLALKANITDVDDALALKADASDVADAMALKAPLDSPALSGTPTTPTPAPGTTTKQIANAEFVDDEFDTRCKTTPTAGKIPVADGNGDIDSGWLKDASETVKGVIELATPAEAVTGTDENRAVHAKGVKAAIDHRIILSGGVPA